MSEKNHFEDKPIVSADFKDGHLQIVEVTPFEKSSETLLPDLTPEGSDQNKYLQVLDTGQELLHLDLLNITLVKCGNDENSYRVIDSDNNDATITCMLTSEDNEDNNQDQYVVMNADDGKDPMVILQSSLQQINNNQKKQINNQTEKKPLTPTEILEKAKALQRAKLLLTSQSSVNKTKGRKRKSDLPPPMELLSSPNFKLYLYNCKWCNFKCNAVKEMSAHKASEHKGSNTRGVGRNASLQCARCPYKGNTHGQLMKHVQDSHTQKNVVKLDSKEVEEADVLVCGACGFESSDRPIFKNHIEKKHGVKAC